jgi:ribose transport system ATP-binding protein
MLNSVIPSPLSPPPQRAAPLLEMRGVGKGFPGVVALESVSFSAYGGEVHALMGENGAGKSTLMKILTGVYRADSGEVLLEQTSIHVANPRDAQRLGIAIIHQELNQVPELSVSENFFLGRELRGRFGAVDVPKMQRETSRFLEQLGIDIDPERLLKHLRVAERQLLEIAKAISSNAKVLVMDEPTTALSGEEVARLFTVIERLRASGMAIIYISHRMDEIFSIAQRITVLRDGRWVGTLPTSQLDRNQLIQMMVGRELRELYPSSQRDYGQTILRVENLDVQRYATKQPLEQITFSLQAGEIVGLAGLLGAGRTELLEAIYGVPHPALVSGTIQVGKTQAKSPREAIDAGIGFVTEDRKGQSLVLARSVGENASLAALHFFTKGFWLQLGKEKQAVQSVIERLRVKTPHLETNVGSLSGGNQQKVVLAKFLFHPPKLLLLDEPTQGIDVGAKAEIYTLMNELAKAGTAVLLASSDMPELLALCDRILVMCEGRITGQLSRSEATSERILEFATRFKTQETP